MTRVTAIVCVRDGAARLARALASIRAQTLPPDEVLVVDGRSADGSAAIARAWGARLVTQAGSGLADARNLIDNLGLGEAATNTRRSTPIEAVRRSHPAPVEDRPPAAVAADPAYDRLVWELRSGRHSAAGLVLWGGRMVERGRAIQALALAHGGLRRYPGDAGLVALAARASAALGR